MTTSDARKRLAELRESSVASAGGLEEAIARAEVAEAERDHLRATVARIEAALTAVGEHGDAYTFDDHNALVPCVRIDCMRAALSTKARS